MKKEIKINVEERMLEAVEKARLFIRNSNPKSTGQEPHNAH